MAGLGALGYVGYGVEAVEGTAVAPTFYLPVSSTSFEDTNDYKVPDQVRHSRDRSVAMAAPFTVSGKVDMDLIPTDIGPLLKSVLGATIVSSAYAGGGYQHVLTPGNAEPTLTFETSAADILVMRYAGCRVNTLEIKGNFGEIVTASFGIEGLNRAKQAGTTNPAYSSVLPFHFSGAGIKIGGTTVATIKDFTFTTGANLTRVGTLQKTRAWKRMAPGLRDVGLSLTADFIDTTEYDRFNADGVTFSVEINLEGTVMPNGTGKYGLDILIPQVQYNKVTTAIATGLLDQAIEGLVTKAAASAIFTMTWVTTQDATAAGLA